MWSTKMKIVEKEKKNILTQQCYNYTDILVCLYPVCLYWMSTDKTQSNKH